MNEQDKKKQFSEGMKTSSTGAKVSNIIAIRLGLNTQSQTPKPKK